MDVCHLLLANKNKKKKVNEKKIESSWNRCWKEKCRAALKDDRGRILDEFFFGNSYQGILELIKRIQDHGTKKCNAVLESTGNMWMRVHDTLEDNGIGTILANTYKTKIIARKQR